MNHRSLIYFQLLLILVQVDGTLNHDTTKAIKRKDPQLAKKLRISPDRLVDVASQQQRAEPIQNDSEVNVRFEPHSKGTKFQNVDHIMKHETRCSVIGRSSDGVWYEAECGGKSAVDHHINNKSEHRNNNDATGGVFHFDFDPKQLLHDLPAPPTSLSHADAIDDSHIDEPHESNTKAKVSVSSDKSQQQKGKGYNVIIHHGGTRGKGALKHHKITSLYQEQEKSSEGKGGKGGNSKTKSAKQGKDKSKSKGKGKGGKGKGESGKGKGKGKEEKYEFEPRPLPRPSRQPTLRPFDRPVIIDPPPRKPNAAFTLAPTPESQNDVTPAPTPKREIGPGTPGPTTERDNGPGDTSAPSSDRQNELGTQPPTLSPTSNIYMTPTGIPSAMQTLYRSPSPKAEPTPVPIADITGLPTIIPTGSPSTDPTSNPTISPTTISPTNAPVSRAPAIGPSTFPPTVSPTTKSPTPTPTQGPTRTPTIAPTTLVVSSAPVSVTEAPIISPSSRPTQTTVTKIPSGSPAGAIITSAPSIPPTGSATTAIPTESLLDGIRVPVTRFDVDYIISETVNDFQFGEAEKITLDYLRQFMEQQFAFNSLTDLIDFRGTLVTQDNAATVATYDIDLIFATGSIGTPTSEEADLLVFAAFNQPFVPQLITQLQSLAASNPFSQTNAVTYNPVQRRRWLVELSMLPGPPGLSVTLY